MTRTNLKTNPANRGPASSSLYTDGDDDIGAKGSQQSKRTANNSSSEAGNNSLIRKPRLPPTSFVLQAITCLSEAKLLNIPLTINHYIPLLKCVLLAEIDKDLPMRLLADAATTVADTFRESGRDQPDEAAKKAIFKAQVAVAGTFAVTGNWQQALLLCGSDPTFAALIKSLVDSQQWPWAFYLVNQVVEVNRRQYLRSVSVAESYAATARAAVDYGMRVAFAAANPIAKKLAGGGHNSSERLQNDSHDPSTKEGDATTAAGTPSTPSPIDATVVKLYLDFSDPAACAFAVENSTKYAENQVAPYNCLPPQEVSNLYDRWCELTQEWILSHHSQEALEENEKAEGRNVTPKFLTRQIIEPLFLAAPPGKVFAALHFFPYFRDHYHRRVEYLKQQTLALQNNDRTTPHEKAINKLSEVEIGEIIPLGIIIRGLHRSCEWRTVLRFFCETNTESKWRKHDPKRAAVIQRIKAVLGADGSHRSGDLAQLLMNQIPLLNDKSDIVEATQIPIRPNVIAGDRWSAADEAHVLLSLGQAILCQNGDAVDLSQTHLHTSTTNGGEDTGISSRLEKAGDEKKVTDKITPLSTLNSELDRQLAALKCEDDDISWNNTHNLQNVSSRSTLSLDSKEQEKPTELKPHREFFTGKDVIAVADLLPDDNTHKHMAILHILSRGGKGCPTGSHWERCVQALQHTDPLSNIFIDLVVWQLTTCGKFEKANEVFENFMRSRKRRAVALGSHHQYPRWPIFSYLMLASSALRHSTSSEEVATASLLRLIELGAPRIDAWNIAHAIACLLCAVQKVPTIPPDMLQTRGRPIAAPNTQSGGSEGGHENPSSLKFSLLHQDTSDAGPLMNDQHTLPSTTTALLAAPPDGITYRRIRAFKLKKLNGTLPEEERRPSSRTAISIALQPNKTPSSPSDELPAPIQHLMQLFRSGKMDAMRPRTQQEFNNLCIYFLKQVQSVCKYHSEIEHRTPLECQQQYIHNHDDLRACHMSLLRRYQGEVPDAEMKIAPRRSERMLYRLDGAASGVAAVIKELSQPPQLQQSFTTTSQRASSTDRYQGSKSQPQRHPFSTEVVAKAVIRMGLPMTLDTLFE